MFEAGSETTTPAPVPVTLATDACLRLFVKVVAKGFAACPHCHYCAFLRFEHEVDDADYESQHPPATSDSPS